MNRPAGAGGGVVPDDDAPVHPCFPNDDRDGVGHGVSWLAGFLLEKIGAR